jgi:hypothetical protein
LERSTRWKDAEITRIRVRSGGVREVDAHAKAGGFAMLSTRDRIGVGWDSDRRWRMEAETREDKVCVWMTKEEAQNLLREIDKWPELPTVERDLVNALKELPRTS